MVQEYTSLDVNRKNVVSCCKHGPLVAIQMLYIQVNMNACTIGQDCGTYMDISL